MSKFLGIIIEDKLSWKDHVAYISNKISKGIGIMMKARKYFHQKILFNLYYISIYPYIVYCNHIWGQTYDKCIEKISVLQRRVIRIIAGVNQRTNTDIYYDKFQTLNVKQINMYVICLFMYRFHRNLLPEVFDNYFTLNRNLHAYNTRQCQLLRVPPVPLTWQREVWNIGESKFGFNFLDKKSILMYPNQYLSIIAKESSLVVI